MERIKGALVIGLLRLVALLPWSAVQRVGAGLGWLMYRLPNRSREVARINLAHCFPQMSEAERDQLLRETLVENGKAMAECACVWLWPVQRTLALVREVEGLEYLHQALASGKAVIGITSHLGNWEVTNHYFCANSDPIVFYRPPKLKAVDDLLRVQRAQLGNRIAPSTREGITAVMREVRRGGVVGVPADPEPALASGLFVPFFGTQALTSKFVPGMMAGGKALGVFLHTLRLPDGSGYKVILEPAPDAMYSEDIETAVAAMSATIERYVAKWPSQYTWTMKRFKKRPPGEARWY